MKLAQSEIQENLSICSSGQIPNRNREAVSCSPGKHLKHEAIIYLASTFGFLYAYSPTRAKLQSS